MMKNTSFTTKFMYRISIREIKSPLFGAVAAPLRDSDRLWYIFLGQFRTQTLWDFYEILLCQRWSSQSGVTLCISACGGDSWYQIPVDSLDTRKQNTSTYSVFFPDWHFLWFGFQKIFTAPHLPEIVLPVFRSPYQEIDIRYSCPRSSNDISLCLPPYDPPCFSTSQIWSPK